jgi:hypothetical protein
LLMRLCAPAPPPTTGAGRRAPRAAERRRVVAPPWSGPPYKPRPATRPFVRARPGPQAKAGRRAPGRGRGARLVELCVGVLALAGARGGAVGQHAPDVPAAVVRGLTRLPWFGDGAGREALRRGGGGLRERAWGGRAGEAERRLAPRIGGERSCFSVWLSGRAASAAKALTAAKRPSAPHGTRLASAG